VSTANFAGLEILAVLVVAGIVAGFLNTLAGGGSLLTMPVLVLAGLSWESANATSRLSVLLQTATATRGFLTHERLSRRETVEMARPTLLGTLIGAGATHVLDVRTFEPVAVGLLVAVGLAMLIAPNFAPSTPKTLAERPRARVLLFLIGLYAGFIQAGIGYLLLAFFSGVLGRDLATGNALKSALVLLCTLVALPVLGLDAPIHWGYGLALGLGAMLGAHLGVRYAIRASNRALRLILLGTLAFVVAASLLR
jgi:hypothetical protein